MINIPETTLQQNVHSIQDVLNLIYRALRGQDPNVNGLSIDVPIQPIGSHSSGTDISSAVTLSPPAGATKILMQSMTANARYTLDGTAPTTTLGFQLKAGDPPIIISVVPGVTIRVIQETASSNFQYQWSR